MKRNVRSFRYSDEVANFLESAPGENMSEKFENLILLAHAAVPLLEVEKACLQNELFDLRKKRDAVRNQIFDLQALRLKQDALYCSMSDFLKQAAKAAQEA